MLHTHKRVVTLNPSSNDADARQPRASIIQYMSHRYNVLLNKLLSHSSSSDASSQACIPINNKQVNSPSSGFCGPLSPELGDGELHCLPTADQTVWGRMHLSLIGPPSGNSIQMSLLQSPSSIYDRNPKLVYLSSSFWYSESSIQIRINHPGTIWKHAFNQLEWSPVTLMSFFYSVLCQSLVTPVQSSPICVLLHSCHCAHGMSISLLDTISCCSVDTFNLSCCCSQHFHSQDCLIAT